MLSGSKIDGADEDNEGYVETIAQGSINPKPFFTINIYGCNRPNVVVIMSNPASLARNFKIGVLKELHRRNLITREELDKAIIAVQRQYSG
jgi:biotin synthase-related radical SAM superfamily protein